MRKGLFTMAMMKAGWSMVCPIIDDAPGTVGEWTDDIDAWPSGVYVDADVEGLGIERVFRTGGTFLIVKDGAPIDVSTIKRWRRIV